MVDDDLKRLLDAGAAETRRAFEATAERLAAENRHHFDLSGEAVKREVWLVAEAVAHLEEKFAREIGELRGDVRLSFTETQL